MAMPMKNVKIWQLDREMGAGRLFVSYDNLRDNFGPDPVKSLYLKVYDGELPTADPEEVFTWFQWYVEGKRPPAGFAGRSVSVSDVIEIDGVLHYCDTVGFRDVRWADEGGPA